MKNAYVAELAALVSSHSEIIIQDGAAFSDDILNRIHEHSKTRFNTWLRELSLLGQSDPGESPSVRAVALLELADRILIHEILTRVWTAVLTASDIERSVRMAEPVARNVLYGHMVCRHELLSRVLQMAELDPHTLQAIDRTRKKAERWTDLLIGHLVQRYGLEDIAFDDLRCLDFARQHSQHDITDPQCHIWSLILIGIRLAFPQSDNGQGCTTSEDSQFIQTVLEMFPSDTLDCGLAMCPVVPHTPVNNEPID